MSQFVETATKAFVCGEAIGQHVRVTLNSDGKVYKSLKTEKEIGTLESASFADRDVRAVRLTSAQGTVKMVAGAAIAEGAAVHTDLLGKVNSVGPTGSFLVGTALHAVAAAGEIVEVLRNSHGDTANP